MTYLEETLATQYEEWKNNFHTYFKRWDNPEIAHLHVPTELKERIGSGCVNILWTQNLWYVHNILLLFYLFF